MLPQVPLDITQKLDIVRVTEKREDDYIQYTSTFHRFLEQMEMFSFYPKQARKLQH